MAEAQFAFHLIEKFGLVACSPSAEDTSGRQAFELLSPNDVVSRGFSIASLAFAEARRRGLMLQVPDLNEVNAEADAERAAKAAAKKAAQPA